MLVGGASIDAPGYFFAPKVINIVDADSLIANEQIFGSTVPISTFKS